MLARMSSLEDSNNTVYWPYQDCLLRLQKRKGQLLDSEILDFQKFPASPLLPRRNALSSVVCRCILIVGFTYSIMRAVLWKTFRLSIQHISCMYHYVKTCLNEDLDLFGLPWWASRMREKVGDIAYAGYKSLLGLQISIIIFMGTVLRKIGEMCYKSAL